MPNLVTFGCSFTYSGGTCSWSDHTSNKLRLPLKNYAQAGGSNSLQIKRYQRAVIDGEIDEDDIVIWQITSIFRYNKRFKTSNRKDIYENFREDTPHKPTSVNIFDDEERSDCMHLRPNTKTEYRRNDFAENLQELIFHIISCKNISKKTLVIFGWRDVIPLEWVDKFQKLLDEHNVDYIDTPILEHVEVGIHPTEDEYKQFSENIIIPKLNLWL